MYIWVGGCARLWMVGRNMYGNCMCICVGWKNDEGGRKVEDAGGVVGCALSRCLYGLPSGSLGEHMDEFVVLCVGWIV